MRRRDVVKLLIGAAMVAPLRAAAQSARTYRLAMLTSGAVRNELNDGCGADHPASGRHRTDGLAGGKQA